MYNHVYIYIYIICKTFQLVSRPSPPRPWQSSKSEADVAESSGSIDQLRRALREVGQILGDQ